MFTCTWPWPCVAPGRGRARGHAWPSTSRGARAHMYMIIDRARAWLIACTWQKQRPKRSNRFTLHHWQPCRDKHGKRSKRSRVYHARAAGDSTSIQRLRLLLCRGSAAAQRAWPLSLTLDAQLFRALQLQFTFPFAWPTYFQHTGVGPRILRTGNALCPRRSHVVQRISQQDLADAWRRHGCPAAGSAYNQLDATNQNPKHQCLVRPLGKEPARAS
jgi:hypothetical protein